MCIGQVNGNATLSDADVNAIRLLYSKAPLSHGGHRNRNGFCGEVATRFSVSRATVSDIVCGRTWTHLLPTISGEIRAEAYGDE